MESREYADRVYDLDHNPIDPRSIKMTQQPNPAAINYNSNKLAATTNRGMKGSKIPLPIF